MRTSPRLLALLVLATAPVGRAESPAAPTAVTPTATEAPKAPTPPGFALVPAGEFTMGDALDGDKVAPQHKVTVSEFLMQKNLVTKAEWDEVREWGLKHGYTDLPEGDGKAPDHPVQTVSWFDVVKWCNAKTEKEGLVPCYYTGAAKTEVYRKGDKNLANEMVRWDATGYRLPTEAEWEKAARGRLVGRRFPWGDTISHNEANFDNSAWEFYQTGSTGRHPKYGNGDLPYTSPVGSFPANGFGLYDMAGNVAEWCWDWYAPYPATVETDPRGAVPGSYRVFRGGDCGLHARECGVAFRVGSSPANSFYDVGFRVARSCVP